MVAGRISEASTVTDTSFLNDLGSEQISTWEAFDVWNPSTYGILDDWSLDVPVSLEDGLGAVS